MRMVPFPLVMDAEDVAAAGAHRAPETYLRFANTCVTQACQQWQNGRCTVPDQVADHLDTKGLTATPQKCAIRDSCRWFGQDGINACRLCPWVLTDS
ncbi:MAG: hypothetical protein AAF218_00230 [Pseudomonadota bacterium]